MYEFTEFAKQPRWQQGLLQETTETLGGEGPVQLGCQLSWLGGDVETVEASSFQLSFFVPSRCHRGHGLHR